MTITEKDQSPQKMMGDAMEVAVRLQGKIDAARGLLESLIRDAGTARVSHGELKVRLERVISLL